MTADRRPEARAPWERSHLTHGCRTRSARPAGRVSACRRTRTAFAPWRRSTTRRGAWETSTSWWLVSVRMPCSSTREGRSPWRRGSLRRVPSGAPAPGAPREQCGSAADGRAEPTWNWASSRQDTERGSSNAPGSRPHRSPSSPSSSVEATITTSSARVTAEATRHRTEARLGTSARARTDAYAGSAGRSAATGMTRPVEKTTSSGKSRTTRPPGANRPRTRAAVPPTIRSASDGSTGIASSTSSSAPRLPTSHACRSSRCPSRPTNRRRRVTAVIGRSSTRTPGARSAHTRRGTRSSRARASSRRPRWGVRRRGHEAPHLARPPGRWPPRAA